MKKLVVFVGPQGSGKTTQAKLLSENLKLRGLSVHVTSLSYSPLFQQLFLKFAKKVSGTRLVESKFYEDIPTQTAPNIEIIGKTFGLELFLQLICLVFSQIKLAFLKPFSEILIDHEGYIIKQIVDLKGLANGTKINPHSLTEKLSESFSRLLLRLIIKRGIVVIYLEAEAESLKQRYRKRGSHIEPTEFINFQITRIHDIMPYFDCLPESVVAKFDSNQPICGLNREIMGFFAL
jgi:deoxyadenosine/deoxycytidine kinase